MRKHEYRISALLRRRSLAQESWSRSRCGTRLKEYFCLWDLVRLDRDGGRTWIYMGFRHLGCMFRGCVLAWDSDLFPESDVEEVEF